MRWNNGTEVTSSHPETLRKAMTCSVVADRLQKGLLVGSVRSGSVSPIARIGGRRY